MSYFCRKNCKNLLPKEARQTKVKEPHLCQKFNQRVWHFNYHPKLVRLTECMEE